MSRLNRHTWFDTVLVTVVVESGATVSHEHAFPKPDIASSCFLFGVPNANATAPSPFAMTSAMIRFATANWAATFAFRRRRAAGVIVAISVTVCVVDT